MVNRRKMSIILVFVVTMALLAITGINAFDSKEEKIAAKTKKRLEYAYSDIKNSLKLDENLQDYRKVTYPEAIALNREIAREIDDLDQLVPIGSIEPLYFVKNDFSEIMILYKEADGTNVMRRAKKEGNQWEKYEKKIKGAPIVDIDMIRVD
ncbi:hypothetical protein [Thermotalea metallivorans]|uniref:Uncharacterized protein n=1 Tax=Thermotalea metallivorans TaxID=520762 RepID=A0A140L1Q3_9FIRM|nr:hypothetical protein [Thermotalea metallivorans]KXG74478.1 hypothetical protein AN619_23240 [Thermotalea metallivorans]